MFVARYREGQRKVLSEAIGSIEAMLEGGRDDEEEQERGEGEGEGENADAEEGNEGGEGLAEDGANVGQGRTWNSEGAMSGMYADVRDK